MNDHEKYLFDLNGYLVVENVLTPDEVALCNEAIDRHADDIRERIGELSLSGGSETLEGITGRGDLGGMLGWEKPWCEPFRNMLAHPTIVPYLHGILGKGFLENLTSCLRITWRGNVLDFAFKKLSLTSSCFQLSCLLINGFRQRTLCLQAINSMQASYPRRRPGSRNGHGVNSVGLNGIDCISSPH